MTDEDASSPNDPGTSGEERPLPDAIAMAQEAGRKYVTIASRVLAGK